MISLDPAQIPVKEFWTFLLIFVRLTSLIVVAPVFGARGIPPQVKVGLAALFALVLAPQAAPYAPAIPSDLFTLALILIKESAVGLVMGFIAHLVFYAVQMAGQFIDLQMGLQMGQLLDPSQEHTGGAISQFLYTLMILLFLAVDGHHLLLKAFAGSVAPLQGAPAALPLGMASFGPGVLAAFNEQIGGALVVMIKLAAPASIVLFCVDLMFAVLSRTVPTLNVFIVGLPAKILLGLAALLVSLGLITALIGALIAEMAGNLQAIMRAMGQ